MPPPPMTPLPPLGEMSAREAEGDSADAATMPLLLGMPTSEVACPVGWCAVGTWNLRAAVALALAPGPSAAGTAAEALKLFRCATRCECAANRVAWLLWLVVDGGGETAPKPTPKPGASTPY